MARPQGLLSRRLLQGVSGRRTTGADSSVAHNAGTVVVPLLVLVLLVLLVLPVPRPHAG